MTSIFERALGSTEFTRLHPMIQRRFSVGLASGESCRGQGVMDRIWHGGRWVTPFLRVGGSRNILVPQTGRDVPFFIENVPYTDSFGRETVTFVRTFLFPGRTRRFDATMIYSPERGRIVDYLGTHQHIATDLAPEVDEAGALVIRSGEQRFRERRVDLRVPRSISGDAVVRESYDEGAQRFRIQVSVTNRHFGPLFGYEGSFTAEYAPLSDAGPRAELQPVREEKRA